MKDNEDHFEVLRKIDKDQKTSQRKLAEDLGFSLGKLNYCLKALQKKGLVKILGDGEITKKIDLKIHAISEVAKSKIESAVGTVEIINE